jgi:hypothetical protein|tara:strand:- start:63 stop:422 length:360 start_codon:yes stop_codon:yes gene_type:complete
MYEGWWFRDQRVGQGREISGEGYVYTGNWEQDLKKGKGKLVWQTKQRDQTQEGEFLGLTEKGIGTITYSNGDVYIGEWMKDKRNGAGILTKADGTKQEGEWKEDQLVTSEETQTPTGMN